MSHVVLDAVARVEAAGQAMGLAYSDLKTALHDVRGATYAGGGPNAMLAVCAVVAPRDVAIEVAALLIASGCGDLFARDIQPTQTDVTEASGFALRWHHRAGAGSLLGRSPQASANG